MLGSWLRTLIDPLQVGGSTMGKNVRKVSARAWKTKELLICKLHNNERT
jgi:hypothetical protein